MLSPRLLRDLQAIALPRIEATCADGRSVTLGDLRGEIVRLVFGTPASAPGVVTISMMPRSNARLETDFCTADDETVPRAYAVVTGIAPGELPGTQILVDGQGWLRAVQRPGAAPPGWDDPGVLAAELHDIEQHPLAASTGAMPEGMRM